MVNKIKYKLNFKGDDLPSILSKKVDETIEKIHIINGKLDLSTTLNIKNELDYISKYPQETKKGLCETCEEISYDYIPMERENSSIFIDKYNGTGYNLTMYLYRVNNIPYAFEYAVLMQYGDAMMSITPMELVSHFNPIRWAVGNVLVAGLGLGFYVNQILNKDEVKEVHVVENESEIIEMYKERFDIHPKLHIHKDDIFKFKSDIEFDYFYADIWHSRNYTKFNADIQRMLNSNINVKKYSFWGIEEAVWFDLIEKGLDGEGKEILSEIVEQYNMSWAYNDIKELISILLLS